MRKKIVAGNWKMNKTLNEGIALARELNAALADRKPNCEVIIAPPFTHLDRLSQIFAGTPVKLASQNCADKTSGAFTGEVSVSMLASAGATHVIIGHSERRAYYGETPEILREKTRLALAEGLTPIFCIGETLEEREADAQEAVIGKQIADSLFDLSTEKFGKLVLAYEPVWAIGTGRTASPEQAQEVHAFIRGFVRKQYGEHIAENLTILYGGSCNAQNAATLFAQADIDGGLIGGASLIADSFAAIVDAFGNEE